MMNRIYTDRSLDNIVWPTKIFVTGTDTDAGKSYATGELANLINANGGNATTMKFVQTGNKEVSEDIIVHRRIMGIEPTAADRLGLTAPVIFTYPCSPDLAARIDGKEIDLKIVDDAANTLSKQYSTVLIEGAGGLMVPLNGKYLTIDYIRERDLPTVLVTNGKLGSINHTLLAMYAIKQQGIKLFAVVYNSYFDYDKIIAEDTRKYIRGRLEEEFPETLYIEIGEKKL